MLDGANLPSDLASQCRIWAAEGYLAQRSVLQPINRLLPYVEIEKVRLVDSEIGGFNGAREGITGLRIVEQRCCNRPCAERGDVGGEQPVDVIAAPADRQPAL